MDHGSIEVKVKFANIKNLLFLCCKNMNLHFSLFYLNNTRRVKSYLLLLMCKYKLQVIQFNYIK